MRRLAAALALIGATGSGCSLDDGRPPVARIHAEPGVIPEHDNFENRVILDATGSSDPIDDPAGVRSLAYEWSIDGDEFRVEPGSGFSDPTFAVRFRGDTPATVRLTVTDADGLTNTAERRIQLTVAP